MLSLLLCHIIFWTLIICPWCTGNYLLCLQLDSHTLHHMLCILYKEDTVIGCSLISLCISIKWYFFLGEHSPHYTQHFETLILVNSVFYHIRKCSTYLYMCNCTELYFTIFVILITKWLQAIIIGLIIDIIMCLGSFLWKASVNPTDFVFLSRVMVNCELWVRELNCNQCWSSTGQTCLLEDLISKSKPFEEI